MADTPPTPPHAAPAAPVQPAGPAPAAPKLAPKLPPPPKAQNPFVYLGIPQAVFDYRPKMPGPKMATFWAVTIGLTGAYIYDRRECERLQKEYIDQVKWMSEAPLDSMDMSRRVKVLGARVPEDGEVDRSSKWFKRYMRPIFVASGTDYILKTGTNPGGIGRTTLAEIRGRRITEASKDPKFGVSALNSGAANIASVLTDRDAQDAQREVDGGVVLLGRAALKEYLWALRKGYGETIDLKEEARLEGLGLGANERRKDGRWEREEEIMVRELEAEDAKIEHAPFEVPIPAALQGLDGEDDTMTDSAASGDAPSTNPLAFTPYRSITPASLPSTTPEPTKDDSPPVLLPPSATLPAQPPVLLVPFSHPFGVQKWPSKMLHFFNKRSDVRKGGEYALAILLAQHRPFAPPTIRTPAGSLQGVLDDKIVDEVRVGEHKDLTLVEGERTGSPDLDFLAETDENPYHFRRSYRTLPSAHEYSKRSYYKDDLPPKLAVARELASGARPPTKAEENYPPKMESELRKERLDKELRWRRELEGWAMVRSGSGVAWDEKWGVGEGSETPFRVYTVPTEEQKRELKEKRDAWYEDKKRQAEALEERLKSMPSPPADDE